MYIISAVRLSSSHYFTQLLGVVFFLCQQRTLAEIPSIRLWGNSWSPVKSQNKNEKSWKSCQECPWKWNSIPGVWWDVYDNMIKSLYRCIWEMIKLITKKWYVNKRSRKILAFQKIYGIMIHTSSNARYWISFACKWLTWLSGFSFGLCILVSWGF